MSVLSKLKKLCQSLANFFVEHKNFFIVTGDIALFAILGSLLGPIGTGVGMAIGFAAGIVTIECLDAQGISSFSSRRSAPVTSSLQPDSKRPKGRSDVDNKPRHESTVGLSVENAKLSNETNIVMQQDLAETNDCYQQLTSMSKHLLGRAVLSQSLDGQNTQKPMELKLEAGGVTIEIKPKNNI